MSPSHDPLDLLAAARPADHAVDLATDLDARRTLDRVLQADDELAVRRRPRSGRIALLTVVALAAGAGTVAAIVVLRDSPSEVDTLGCWSEASSPPGEVVVVAWDGSDPVAACASSWVDGGFATQATTEAPPLVACVTTTGAVAVVPGARTTCADLGLADFDITTPDVAADNIRRAIDAIERAVSEDTCLDVDEAVSVVEQILATAGLTDWTVAVDAAFAPGACPTAAVDTVGGTVTIVAGV